MRILVAHSAYRHLGGEDAAVGRHVELLRDAGCEVSCLIVKADDLLALPIKKRIGTLLGFPHHSFGVSALRDTLRDFDADVVHFHNLFPALNPGAVEEAHASGAVVVHTVHNYRPTCLAGTRLLGGDPCTRCGAGSYGPGILRGCYRDSRVQSGLLAEALGAYWKDVALGLPDAVVALTPHMRRYLVDAGFPEERVSVVSTAVPEGPGRRWEERSGAVFVGRLSAEKGVAELVRSWRPEEGPLRIVGDGPDREAIERSAVPGVRVEGWLDRDGVEAAIASARVLVVPSPGAEPLPLAALEALGAGTPVVTFGDGSLASVLEGELSACLSEHRWRSLVETSSRVASLDRAAWDALSEAGRHIHRARFSQETVTAALLGLYETCLERAQGRI